MMITDKTMVFALPRKCIERGCSKKAVIGMYRCRDHLNPPKKIRRRRAGPEIPKEETQCWVYFLRGENGLIKIGRTSESVEKRISNIQNMSPVKLELLAEMPAPPKFETLLHKMFAHRRKHGEWFESCEKLEDIIDSIKRNNWLEFKLSLCGSDRDYGPEYVDASVPPEFRDNNVIQDVIKEYFTEFD